MCLINREIGKSPKQLVAMYESVPDHRADELEVLLSTGGVLREHQVMNLETPSRRAPCIRIGHGDQT